MKNNQFIILVGLFPVSFLAVRNDGSFYFETGKVGVASRRHCEGVARSNPVRQCEERSATKYLL
jgi:hypothetical protein